MGFLPMLFVDDVEASSRWYQELFGVTSAHGGPEFEMLAVGEHDIVLQLHKADAEEHGGPRLPAGAARGAGVLLYFQVADVDAVHAAHARAVAMGATVESGPTYIEAAHHTETLVLDPDGYAVAIHSPFTP
jgi:predicted enzyme related to lactoylglutathione lyase